ncbi:hypothetical protein N5J78_21520, partial [Pseudomonas sp. GD03856]|nr:hypothetical protein [Pseudomonas sp. GD03856]
MSPQSSPFRDAWIGKDVRNKRVSDRVLFPSPAPDQKSPALAGLFRFWGYDSPFPKIRVCMWLPPRIIAFR